MAYVDQYTLGEDPTFIHRVQIAVATSAVQIQGEAVGSFTPQQYQKRQALARKVIANPPVFAQLFARLVVTAASITGASTDAQIQTMIDNNWSKMAGIDLGD